MRLLCRMTTGNSTAKKLPCFPARIQDSFYFAVVSGMDEFEDFRDKMVLCRVHVHEPFPDPTGCHCFMCSAWVGRYAPGLK